MERRVGRTRVISQEQVGGVNQAIAVEIPMPRYKNSKRRIEIFLRKGRGLTDGEIGDEFGISRSTVGQFGCIERMRRGPTTLDVIMSMVKEGLITPAQLTEGLDFARDGQLTTREREILDLIS